MIEFLYSLDLSLFYFGNHALQNPIFDAAMPFITDLNKKPVALVIIGILWLLLLIKGGRNGRIAALLLLPTIVISDQLNSSYLKFVIDRMRPCHVLPDVHLLVPCGSGYSFPSSHAVNNFAAGIVLAYFLPRWAWAFLLFASIVAFSRVYVGVHYPSDILAGSVIGLAVGSGVIYAYNRAEAWWIKRKTAIEKR